MKKIFLVLSNGRVFEGCRFGANGETIGEIVFTTSMTGYVETLTDPSYYGQIVLQTFPLIGNYGMIPEDAESNGCFVKGYVVREWCEFPSNFRAKENIDSYLKQNGIVGIYGVDTREITKIIREHGVMNAKIVDDVTDSIQEELNSYSILNAVKGVSCGETQVLTPEADILYNVVLIDYGAKSNIARELVRHGCRVNIVPYNTAIETILSLKPDGVVLSNGPGDPMDNKESIETIKNLIGKIPMFGICLGHQLLALAYGGQTFKLKYGHRGANQPVKNFEDARVYITSQNHGYAVVADSLDDNKAVISMVNANDGTCEGIDYPEDFALSVQFHPEACSGAKDTGFLFKRFIDIMRRYKNATE